MREKLGEEVDENGKKTIEIGFKDARIAGVSAVEWDEKEQAAVCVDTSYVAGIERVILGTATAQKYWISIIQVSISRMRAKRCMVNRHSHSKSIMADGVD